jgi:hypothetical protein
MTPILGVIASSRLAADLYFGYNLGGQGTSGTQFNSVLKWGFTTETNSTLTDTLTYTTAGSAAGVTYKGNRAYKIGGNGDAATSQRYVSKWAYATGTKTDVSTTMTARGYGAGISNPSTAGYSWAGEGGSPLVYFATAQKVSYSSDTLSTVGGGVSQNTNQPAGTNNGTSTGYRIGGDTADVGKLNFSNDTMSAGNGFVMEYVTTCTNGTTATYLMGGQNRTTGILTNQIARFTFSGESFSVLGATLSSARTICAAFSDFATYGWVLGGGESTGPITTIQRFTYSGETISTLGTTLPAARANAATANNYA